VDLIFSKKSGKKKSGSSVPLEGLPLHSLPLMPPALHGKTTWIHRERLWLPPGLGMAPTRGSNLVKQQLLPKSS